MRALALASLVTLAACGGNKPCTACPNVAGLYHYSVAAAQLPSTVCGQLSIGADEGDAYLSQTGPDITLPGFHGVRGTLSESLSASFEPTQIWIDSGDMATMTLSATFSSKDGARTANGTMSLLVASGTGKTCVLTTFVIFTQKGQ